MNNYFSARKPGPDLSLLACSWSMLLYTVPERGVLKSKRSLNLDSSLLNNDEAFWRPGGSFKLDAPWPRLFSSKQDGLDFVW